MKKWLIGAALVIAAVVVLYAASAVARHSPHFSWLFVAVFAAIAATGIALAGRIASHAGPPPEYVERPGPGRRVELGNAEAPTTDVWAGTGRTLGIMAIALVGLLLYVGAYVAGHYLQVGWVVYPALALTAALLVVIIIFAAPRDI